MARRKRSGVDASASPKPDGVGEGAVTASGTPRQRTFGDALSILVPRPQGVTERQARFADMVWAGLSLTAAYDEAYSTANMKRAVVWGRAHDAVRNPSVTVRSSQLRTWEWKMAQDEHEKRRKRVIAGLEARAEDPSVPASVQVKALELLGKVRGTDLFSERVEQIKGDLTAEQVEAQLRAKLTELGLETAPQAPATPLLLPAPRASEPCQPAQDAVLVEPDESEEG